MPRAGAGGWDWAARPSRPAVPRKGERGRGCACELATVPDEQKED